MEAELREWVRHARKPGGHLRQRRVQLGTLRLPRGGRRSEGRILETSTMADPDRYSGRPPKHGRGVWILVLMVAALALFAGWFSGYLG